MYFAFVVLGLVSSVLHQEIGWEERLWNELFCVEWHVKPFCGTETVQVTPLRTLASSP